MAQRIINLGLTPNDGGGDPLRVGGQKINDNFSEIFPLLNNKVKIQQISPESLSGSGTIKSQLLYYLNNRPAYEVKRDEILIYRLPVYSGMQSLILGASTEYYYSSYYFFHQIGAGTFGQGGTHLTILDVSDPLITQQTSDIIDLGAINTNVSAAVNNSGPYTEKFFKGSRNGVDFFYMYVGEESLIGQGEAQTVEGDFINLIDQPVDLTGYLTNLDLFDRYKYLVFDELEEIAGLTDNYYLLFIENDNDYYLASKKAEFFNSKILLKGISTADTTDTYEIGDYTLFKLDFDGGIDVVPDDILEVDNFYWFTFWRYLSGNGETTVHTNNTGDIELSGDGTQGTPLEAELTQNVKDEIADKEDSSNKVQDLNNPNSTTYPSTQAIADLDLDNFKNESSDPFVRESEISDIELDGIGTRNYLHNSDFSLPNPLDNVLGNGNSRSVVDGNILATVTNKIGSQYVGFKNISVNDIGEFTFSIKIKATTSVDRWIFSASGLVGFTGSNKFIDVTGDWQILTWNLTNSTSGSDKTIRLYLQNAEIGDTYEIEWVKLEKTHIHSDWTPAPEDQKEWANLRFVRYDEPQSLTPAEQENARANLGLNIIPSVIALMHGEAEEDIYPVLPNLQWDITIQSIVLVSRDTVTGSDLEARILVDDTPQQGADLIIPANSRASNEVNLIDWDAGQNIDLEVTQTGSTDAGSNLALYIFYSLRN